MLKQAWVVDITDTKIDLDLTALEYDYPAQNTYMHFIWDDRDSRADHHVWECVLEAGLPQDVDEFILLIWW